MRSPGGEGGQERQAKQKGVIDGFEYAKHGGVAGPV